MSEQFILVIGNPIGGITFEGPYNDFDDAREAGESVGDDWWVAALGAPELNELTKLRNIKESLLLAIAHRFLREYDSEIHDGTMKELVGELHTIEDQIGDVK